MQDIIMLEPINVATSHNYDSDQPSSVASDHLPNVFIPMDTSSTNDTLIKKLKSKKKKQLKYILKSEMVVSSKVVQLHISTDMLVDVSEHNNPSPDSPPNNDIALNISISIPQEIMDITFNEIVHELINMIVDQLDSAHLFPALHNTPTDQLSIHYLAPLSSTDVLDKSHSFISSQNSTSQVESSIHPLSFDTCVAVQMAQVAIKKDPNIKHIKAVKHKREYLKSIKAVNHLPIDRNMHYFSVKIHL
ncbi:hypothetical protein C1645_836240 [Glomus cerebriforme]|uniref:Uncharacterized protein n=1 Tax=Glomus cerebriforme TaxID=658196 RepID=A0A397S7C7_9GLOM|nr:hypothetical protein C1645_836240 [Glomus cerebriforme]